MNVGTLWQSGEPYRYRRIKTDLTPVTEPAPVTILTIDVAGTDCVYARHHHGMIADYGVTDDVEPLVRRSYVESSRVGVPLIVVMAHERDRSARREAMFRSARNTIYEYKSDAMKRHVAIPRIAVVSGDVINRALFEQRRPDVDAQQERAEHIIGAPLDGIEHVARVICIGDLVAHSRLGEIAAPKSYMDKFEGAYG